MPRCKMSWVRKGDTPVKVTVTNPPDNAVLVLNVALVPDETLPVLAGLSFGKDELEEGAEWVTPAQYKAIFTLVTTTNEALQTEVLLGGEVPSCPTGGHCYGSCAPSGQAGLAGYWTLTTWK